MHTKGPKEDPLVDLGYETRDVNYKAVRTSVIGFLIFSFICAMVAVVIYRNKFLIFGLKNTDSRPYTRRLPGEPNPLLQDNLSSKVDLPTLRQSERARLDSTGYADDTHQAAHIPIDKAMEMLAQQSGGNSPIATPTTTPDNAAPDATTTPSVTEAPGATTSPSVTTPGTAAPVITPPGNGSESALPSGSGTTAPSATPSAGSAPGSETAAPSSGTSNAATSAATRKPTSTNPPAGTKPTPTHP